MKTLSSYFLMIFVSIFSHQVNAQSPCATGLAAGYLAIAVGALDATPNCDGTNGAACKTAQDNLYLAEAELSKSLNSQTASRECIPCNPKPIEDVAKDINVQYARLKLRKFSSRHTNLAFTAKQWRSYICGNGTLPANEFQVQTALEGDWYMEGQDYTVRVVNDVKTGKYIFYPSKGKSTYAYYIDNPGTKIYLENWPAYGTVSSDGNKISFRGWTLIRGTNKNPRVTFSGDYSTKWGTLRIRQNGNSITGNYGHDNGRLTGRVSGNKIIGTWKEDASKQGNDDGQFEFTFASNGNSFTGKWRYGSSGNWSHDWAGNKKG